MKHSNRIVILSCGSKKIDHQSPALALYCGSFFKAQRRWALSVVSYHQIYILSAKYGFLKATDKIEPYELKMGDKGSIDCKRLRHQAVELKLLEPTLDIVSLVGENYKKVLTQAVPNIKYPLDGMPIGIRMMNLKKNERKWP